MNICEALKAARAQLGESQDEFAKRFGVDQSAYSRWETGERTPSGPAQKLIDLELAKIEAELSEAAE